MLFGYMTSGVCFTGYEKLRESAICTATIGKVIYWTSTVCVTVTK